MSAFHLQHTLPPSCLLPLHLPSHCAATTRQSLVEHKTLEFISQQPFATIFSLCVCVWVFFLLFFFFLFLFFVFLGIGKCNFLGTFAQKLAGSVFVFVFVCLPVGCLNCSMHVVNRLSCGQVTLSYPHPLLLSAPHFRLAACCTYFRFCTFLAFSLPWSLLAFSLPPFFFFCCTLRFSHLFGAVTFSLSPVSRLPTACVLLSLLLLLLPQEMTSICC